MSHSRSYGLLLIGVTLACVAAVWASYYSPLVDFPSHLARAYVLDVYDEVAPFQQWYRVSWSPAPNLATDLLIPPMLAVVNPVTAGKIFLTLYVVLFALGVHLLFREAEQGVSFLAPPTVFLCFHSGYQFGFINFSFSIALFLIGLACWLRYLREPSPGGWLLVAALGVATYFSHLAGFFPLAFSAGVMSLYRLFRRETTFVAMARDVSMLLLPVVIHLWPKQDALVANNILFGGVKDKLIGLANIFVSNVWQLDALRLAVIAAAGAVLLWARAVSFRMMFLLPALGLLLVYLPFPQQIYENSGAGADVRLILPMYLLLLAALRLRPSPQQGRALLAAVLAVSLAWVAGLAATWREMSRRVDVYVEMLDSVRLGSKILGVVSTDAPRLESRLRRALLHAPAYAMIRRNAAFSGFFGEPGAQPVIFRDDDEWPILTHWESGTPERLARTLPAYDYVASCYLPAEADRVIETAGGEPIAQDQACTVWRLSPTDE